jgi:hypothetical protein
VLCFHEVWRLGTLFGLIELSWRNGFGVTPQKGKLCVDCRWKLNMRSCGVGVAPMRCTGPMCGGVEKHWERMGGFL